MVPEIDIAAFAEAQRAGAFVVDVREPAEYTAAHVPGAVLMPMGQVLARMGELPRDRRVHVICASGNRSYTAAGWLSSQGLDACSVAGGTVAWARSGAELERGLPAHN